jgi:hypothetical protein
MFSFTSRGKAGMVLLSMRTSRAICAAVSDPISLLSQSASCVYHTYLDTSLSGDGDDIAG